MVEVWKNVIGYEGLYQISNLGRIKSLSRYVKNRLGTGYSLKSEKFLKLAINYGYHYIGLHKNNKIKMFRVHRLVAIHFIPNPDSLPQINHINGIKTDNSVSNLEWCTAKQNTRHAHDNGLANPLKGVNCNLHILTEKQVLEIRSKYIKNVYGCNRLAKDFNTDSVNIWHIVTRKTWKHI